MDSKIIQEYIDKGQELELLDKMNSYVITEVDNRFLNMVQILVILQEKAKIDWTQANRALVSLITKMLSKVFSDQGSVKLDALLDAIEKSAPAPYLNTTYLGRQFIIGIQDKDDIFSDTEISQENLEILKERLKMLNSRLLRKAIEEGEEYSVLINVLYNCVDRLGEERKTFLIPEALTLFETYVRDHPGDYLKSFIRPYYSGTNKTFIDYYFHVPEPFHPQIFGNDFAGFLNTLPMEGIDQSLIDDIRSFYTDFQNASSLGRDRMVILYSAEMDRGGMDKPEKMMKLESSEHKWVRQECLPPLYRSEDKIQQKETYGF
jgi:hypothetical protein